MKEVFAARPTDECFAPVERGEVGWTTTASVDYGSGRPENGTPREAMPQCARLTTEDEPGTASYYILVQPRES